MAVLVIADDFTGAHEAGALFASSGIACTLLPHWQALKGSSLEKPAIVVNTSTRHAGAREAAEIIGLLASQARESGIEFVFKKTDSTLRGAIGAELGTLAETFESAVAFIPAYPSMGRITRGGRLYVHGVPLEESDFRRDARQPARTSVVAEVIFSTYRGSVASIGDADQFRPGEGEETGAAILVFDAESDQDILRIARRLQTTGHLRLTAGPAGVLPALIAVMDLPRTPVTPVPEVSRLLVVSGSLHTASRSQTEAMAVTGTRRIRLDEDTLDTGQVTWDPVLILESRNPIAGTHVPVLAAEETARKLARTAREVFIEGAYQAVLVFGGDTAMALIEAFQAPQLTPLGELAPGVAVSQMEIPGGQCLFASKAGGFGNVGLGIELRCSLHPAFSVLRRDAGSSSGLSK